MDIKIVRTVDANNPVEGDLYLDDDGQLVLVDGEEAISQHLLQRMRFFLGEWFLDRREGVPYFRDILGIKNPSKALIRSIFRKVILGTPGIEALQEINVEIDAATRRATVEFVAATTDGSTITSDDYGPFIVEV